MASTYETSGPIIKIFVSFQTAKYNRYTDELLPLVDVEDIVPKTLTKKEVLSCLSKIYTHVGW